MSDEFSVLLALTQLEREKVHGFKSLEAASKMAADYQHRAEVAEAALARVSAAIAVLLKLQYKAFEDAESGYRNAAGYADAYENAGRLITDALGPKP